MMVPTMIQGWPPSGYAGYPIPCPLGANPSHPLYQPPTYVGNQFQQPPNPWAGLMPPRTASHGATEAHATLGPPSLPDVGEPQQLLGHIEASQENQSKLGSGDGGSESALVVSPARSGRHHRQGAPVQPPGVMMYPPGLLYPTQQPTLSQGYFAGPQHPPAQTQTAWAFGGQAPAAPSVAVPTVGKGKGRKPPVRPFPELCQLESLSQLWMLYDEGNGYGAAPWRENEAQGTEWRHGYRKRWHEIKTFVEVVQQVQASQPDLSCKEVVAAMDRARKKSDGRVIQVAHYAKKAKEYAKELQFHTPTLTTQHSAPPPVMTTQNVTGTALPAQAPKRVGGKRRRAQAG